MKNFNAEMIEKAKAAKSAEELLELAKANGMEITADEAATYFAQLNPANGALNDDDLDAVAGGGSICRNMKNQNKTVRVTSGQTCKQCGSDLGILRTGPYSGNCIYCVNCDNLIGNTGNCTYDVVD